MIIAGADQDLQRLAAPEERRTVAAVRHYTVPRTLTTDS